jgi:glycosyltransferase involved in cell wall biosynthesis
VYNAEKYIYRCIDSILTQTFSDFEVLLVDDGSPDNCGRICDEYAKRDNRVRVLHKKNGGVSSARQYGLENAVGEYIIHADPDDWIECNMLDSLYAKAKSEDADMVICDFIMEFPKKTVAVKQNIQNLKADEVLRLLLQQKLHGACWNKLVRASLFKSYSINFPTDIIRWEDLYVICNLLLHPIKVCYLQEAFYHYDQIINPESIVRKPSLWGVESQIKFCNYFQSTLIPKEKYAEELYIIKSCTKELMCISGLYTYDKIKEIFEDINLEYIKRNKKFNFSIQYILSLILQGKHTHARIIYYLIYNIIFPLKNKIKK